MNRQKILLLIGIIVSVIVLTTGFFLMKNSVKKSIQPCNPATTDCSGLTPLGTPYVLPPKEASPATTTQSGKIDEHLTINNTLRDVNFCGKTYQVKQVMIDGVDVVQRIAELVTKDQFMKKDSLNNPDMGFCKSFIDMIDLNKDNPSWKNEIEVSRVTNWVNEAGHKTYNLYMNYIYTLNGFHIDTTTGDIYEINRYEGGLIGPIGTLK